MPDQCLLCVNFRSVRIVKLDRPGWTLSVNQVLEGIFGLFVRPTQKRELESHPQECKELWITVKISDVILVFVN